MHEAEELCDRVAIIDHGAIIASARLRTSKVHLNRRHRRTRGHLSGGERGADARVPGIKSVTVTSKDSGLTSSRCGVPGFARDSPSSSGHRERSSASYPTPRSFVSRNLWR